MPITVSGTSIVFNDSTTQTTAFTGGGVTSLNGQTGAITNTTFGAIGSYSPLYVDSANNVVYAPGSTLAGSSLRVRTGAGLDPDNFSNPFSDVQVGNSENPNLSGTWRAMARSKNQAGNFSNVVCPNLWVRIS